MKQTFGQTLRAVRMEMGLGYHEVSDQAGVSKKELRSWERDEARPTPQQFKRLAGLMKRLEPLKYQLVHSDAVEYQMATEVARRAEAGDDLRILPARFEVVAGPNPIGVVLQAAPASFSDGLAYWRKYEGLTQQEIAELCGVTDSSVADWESGRNTPVRVNWEKLHELFPKLHEPDWKDRPVPVGNRYGTIDGVIADSGLGNVGEYPTACEYTAPDGEPCMLHTGHVGDCGGDVTPSGAPVIEFDVPAASKPLRPTALPELFLRGIALAQARARLARCERDAINARTAANDAEAAVEKARGEVELESARLDTVILGDLDS